MDNKSPFFNLSNSNYWHKYWFVSLFSIVWSVGIEIIAWQYLLQILTIILYDKINYDIFY